MGDLLKIEILRKMIVMKKILEIDTDIKILMKTFVIIASVVVFVFGGLALSSLIVALLN